MPQNRYIESRYHAEEEPKQIKNPLPTNKGKYLKGENTSNSDYIFFTHLDGQCHIWLVYVRLGNDRLRCYVELILG